MLAAGVPAPGAPPVGRGAAPLTPPMGMMTWQKFRCNGPGANGPLDDCTDADTTYCISHALIVGQAAAMARGGFGSHKRIGRCRLDSRCSAGAQKRSSGWN
jgi:hypothetical protein